MKRIGCFVLFFLFKRICCDENDDLCTIYLAPSSIKGADSLGIYTTESFETGDIILPADGPNIPVADPYEKAGQWTKLFDRYWWGHGGSDEVNREANVGLDFQITFGSLPNHHSKLVSIDASFPNPYFDDSTSSRFLDPSAGAYSYYLGRHFVAGRKIQGGEELFLDYGHPNWPGGEKVPLLEDYDTAGQVICGLLRDPKNADKTVEILFQKLINVKRSLSPRVASTLPKTLQEFNLISKKLLPERACRDPGFHLAMELSIEKRSIDWIRNNGICLDNIVPGPSTIPDAGKGAFASRNLAKGDMIVPVPFLHVTDRDYSMTYSVLNEENGDQILHQQKQLLINYCFGHEESTLLLCPETNAVLINHCSTRLGQCGKEGPNAVYRWADWDTDTEEWKKMTLDELREHWSRGLSFEIVATRDIQKNEEIFIDYGIAWEKAWQEHVHNWKPPETTSPFYHNNHSTSLINQKAEISSEFITNDLRKDKWPTDHVRTYCVFWEDEYIQIMTAGYWLLKRMIPFKDTSAMYDDLWADDLDDEEIIEHYGINGNEFELGWNEAVDGEWFWPCQVIRKEENDEEESLSYTVRVFQSSFHDSMWWNDIDFPRFVIDLPRTSIRVFHEPYKSDIHLPGAFRHFIEIRDEIFPEHWKDLKETPAATNTEL